MNRIRCKLSDLVEVKNGSTPSTTRSDFYDGNIVWITPKDLSNNKSKFIYSSERKITKAGFDSCSTSLLPIGSVLLSSRAPIGLLAICAVETCTNQGFKNLVVQKDKLHNEYLYYWLKTKVKYIDSLGTGTTFKEVSKGVIENLVIELPKDLKDQQKIASVLSALDSKIELNKRINAELEAMAKTLYDYWFVQFDFPDKNGKPYKSSGGTLVWNEELKREIPEGWDVKNLGVVCNLYQPKTISQNEMVPNGKYVVFGANGVVGRYNEFNHKESEIVVTCRGNSCGNIIRTTPFSWITGNAMVIKPMEAIFSSEYIYQSLQWSNISKVITGSAQPQITRINLAPLNILVPQNEYLEKYNKFSKPIVEKKLMIIKENQKLTELRDWLLPMLMNGQVKVN